MELRISSQILLSNKPPPSISWCPLSIYLHIGHQLGKTYCCFKTKKIKRIKCLKSWRKSKESTSNRRMRSNFNQFQISHRRWGTSLGQVLNSSSTTSCWPLRRREWRIMTLSTSCKTYIATAVWYSISHQCPDWMRKIWKYMTAASRNFFQMPIV